MKQSELLHVREPLGIAHALRHLVAVLDVLVHVFNAGVEDVGQAVLAQVLHAEDAVGLGVRVVRAEPERAQLVDGVEVALRLRQRVDEGLVVDAEAGQHCPSVLFVAEDVVEDGLAVVLGDVLGLADVDRHILGVLAVRLVGILLLARHSLPPPPYFILLPLVIQQLLILGGIFVGVSGAHLTVVLAALNGLGLLLRAGPEFDERVVDEQLLVELVGELEELVVVLIVEIEADGLILGNDWQGLRVGGRLLVRRGGGGGGSRIGVELHYNAPT